MRLLTALSNYSDDSNNKLIVEDGCKFDRSRISFRESGSIVSVGKNVCFYNCDIRLGKNSKLYVGDGASIDGRIDVGLNSSVYIGRGVTVTKRLLIRAVESTTIKIGDDCIIASDVSIRTNDGHIIYDATTRERLNPSAPIDIEDHVWLCDECMVFKGVTIGQASVIAARSIVTKSVDRNSIYAGAPAKKVRGGVTWERDVKTVSERFYLASLSLPQEE
ncbi:acyltransferase [Sinorhizobium meliloti]|uniref:acyltransferase n=1 Tax=Rhizobium meliloti TaxID=382 RepID=UPI000FD4A5D4|nr:acyltransferase [Sinorhizobium meliloti]MDE3784894.1 acyltransferase [Sinorhizobium meliloti]RVG32125.1 acyltransferase [Sinorhizobium meliloti]RVI11106.1 acyltransferase [Sinorhizobium meliloti]